MTYGFDRLTPENALLNWTFAESFLQAALDEDPYTLLTVADLQHQVRRSGMALWLVHNDAKLVGAFVTEHVRASKGSAINIVALGGNEMPMWIDKFSTEMVAYSKALRCLYVCEMGRAGWARVLERLGWFGHSRVMLKMAV